ncbi:hypothetical protein CEXT_126231 [Caerostris extrusa]|uniref:LAGLIDADG homing endonuclease n=1 Tax=Caerostris extrusa TaxID=172846 RepID=A0AAV4QYH8_CAEEX|nr:hypothetical protein CEXT_126231 [Caerostris extrusa]
MTGIILDIPINRTKLFSSLSASTGFNVKRKRGSGGGYGIKPSKVLLDPKGLRFLIKFITKRRLGKCFQNINLLTMDTRQPSTLSSHYASQKAIWRQGFSKTILPGNPTVNYRNQIRNAMSKVFQQHPDYFTTGE